MLNAGVITSKENQGAGSQNRPLLLDLYCGAGGASRGYQNAGFRVIGNDIKEQPHYIGDDFIMMDALQLMARLLDGRSITGHGGQSYKLDDFRIIAASPPCQRYSWETPEDYKSSHPDLIGPTREALIATGRPYIIENVAGARGKLIFPAMLCGSMFGLGVWRHRYFEVFDGAKHLLLLTPPCNHSNVPILVTGTPRRKGYPRQDPSKCQKEHAIGIDWMITTELDQAIPPAYTEWLGRRILEAAS